MDTSLLGVETPDLWLEVSRTAQDNSFLTSAVMLVWLSALAWPSWLGWEGEADIRVLPGSEVHRTWSLVMTWIKVGSQVRSLDVVVLWAINTGRGLSLAPDFCLAPQGTPPSPYTVKVNVLPGGRDICMHFCWAPNWSWCLGDLL